MPSGYERTGIAPARIGVVGTGFISRLFVQAVADVSDVRVVSVLTRRPLDQCGEYPRPDLLTDSAEQLVESSDVVFECSGDPVHAFAVASLAVDAGIPVVTMNTEFHVTCGSAFVGRGLVTEAEGDQPGCLASLREEALEMGFRPLVYGNMKGFLNHAPTREEMEHWGAKQHISLEMVTASTDGTKVQFEQALVANGCGATIAQQGLLGLQYDDLRAGGEALAAHAERLGQPISDYLLSARLGHGVFIVATHEAAQRDALAYYKLGDGPYYVLQRPNIFVHLEVLRSIRRVLREGAGVLDNSATPTVSVAAVAKHALPPGTRLEHALGSFDVRGEAVRYLDAPGHVPLGLLSGSVLRRRVEPGQVLTFDDVEVVESPALAAWREIAQRVVTESDGRTAIASPPVRTNPIATASSAPPASDLETASAPAAGGHVHRDDCRACGSRDLEEFLDLGRTPLANSFLSVDELSEDEEQFPLVVSRCQACGLVQLRDAVDPAVLFRHYLYFSSASPPVVEHNRQVAQDLLARYIEADDLVCEIGSNDGVFLQHFVGHCRVLGVDPAENLAAVAATKGVPTLSRFFNRETAREVLDTHGPAKLVFAANVLAHIDRLEDAMAGIADLLAPDGVLVFEVQRCLDLLHSRHFDQIYHEHVCYWALRPIEVMLARYGLRAIDVRIVPTQGESYQVHAARVTGDYAVAPSVAAVRDEERALGIEDPGLYRDYGAAVHDTARALRELLERLRSEGKRIIGYGAPAKATTLLSVAGIDGRHLEYVVDSTPAKQGRYLPGSHIPIRAPEVLAEDTPEYVLLLAWNFADAIVKREQALIDRGARFILPLPRPEVL